MGYWADRLVAELDDLEDWPNPAHREALDRVTRGIALRDGDEGILRHLAGWDVGARAERRFVRDPMPSRISKSFAALVFGRQPRFTAAAPNDQGRLDDLVRINNFRSAIGRAARTCSSEGEVWWRAYVDRTIEEAPLLEWHSRTSVYPLWHAARLMALAFVTRLPDLDGRAYRRFEVHEVDLETKLGRVENVLYEADLGAEERGGGNGEAVPGLGERVALDRHPDCEGLMPEWNHGVPGMLGGRIVNMEGTDPTVGVSDYAEVEDFLVELSIVASIGTSNLELTGRKRIVVPEDEVDPESGGVDVGEQVYVETEANTDLGSGPSGSRGWRVLEYSFDADAMVTYKREVERTALTRIGVDMQYAGLEAAEGRAESGTALRIRLIPSMASGEERAEDWDEKLPEAVLRLQQLDAAPNQDVVPGAARGFGRPWREPNEAPGMDRGDPLPEDRTEATERRASAVAGRIMSRETAIREDHSEWEDEEVEAELDRIWEDESSSTPSFGDLFGARMPPDDPDQEGAGTDPAGDRPEPTPGGPDQPGAESDSAT